VSIAACSSSTEPLTDVDRARSIWLVHHPASYRFDLALASSWFPMSAFTHVVVEDGRVVTPHVTPSNVTPTIDEIWDRLLEARDKRQLNSALFDFNGVPLVADMGPWEVDGGVRYSIRNFARGP